VVRISFPGGTTGHTKEENENNNQPKKGGLQAPLAILLLAALVFGLGGSFAVVAKPRGRLPWYPAEKAFGDSKVKSVASLVAPRLKNLQRACSYA
jgi:hypothetical protein